MRGTGPHPAIPSGKRWQRSPGEGWQSGRPVQLNQATRRTGRCMVTRRPPLFSLGSDADAQGACPPSNAHTAEHQRPESHRSVGVGTGPAWPGSSDSRARAGRPSTSDLQINSKYFVVLVCRKHCLGHSYTWEMAHCLAETAAELCVLYCIWQSRVRPIGEKVLPGEPAKQWSRDLHRDLPGCGASEGACPMSRRQAVSHSG